MAIFTEYETISVDRTNNSNCWLLRRHVLKVKQLKQKGYSWDLWNWVIFMRHVLLAKQFLSCEQMWHWLFKYIAIQRQIIIILISKIYCQPLLPGSAELQPGSVQLGRHDERTDPQKSTRSSPAPIGGGCGHPQKLPATETLLSLAKILKLEIKHFEAVHVLKAKQFLNHVPKFVFGIEKSSFERSANFSTFY